MPPDILSSAAVAAFVVASAAGLMIWHVRAWRQHQREAVADDFDYRRRQFRRRMQTSAMLGVLGLAVVAGRLLMTLRLSPTFIVLYWLGTLVLLGWIALLALVDVWATKHHFGRMRTDYLVEQAKLRAELRRHAAGGNGRDPHPDSPN